MYRDKTVPISFAAFLIGMVIFAILFNQNVTNHAAWAIGLGVVAWLGMFVAMLRMIALWFQTLTHVIKHGPETAKVWWIIGHFTFGFPVSYWYYFKTRAKLN